MPSPFGMNLAVYTVEDVAAKSLSAPPEITISSRARVEVALLEVSVTIKELSFVVESEVITAPEAFAAVISTVGALPS